MVPYDGLLIRHVFVPASNGLWIYSDPDQDKADTEDERMNITIKNH